MDGTEEPEPRWTAGEGRPRGGYLRDNPLVRIEAGLTRPLRSPMLWAVITGVAAAILYVAAVCVSDGLQWRGGVMPPRGTVALVLAMASRVGRALFALLCLFGTALAWTREQEPRRREELAVTPDVVRLLLGGRTLLWLALPLALESLIALISVLSVPLHTLCSTPLIPHWVDLASTPSARQAASSVSPVLFVLVTGPVGALKLGAGAALGIVLVGLFAARTGRPVISVVLGLLLCVPVVFLGEVVVRIVSGISLIMDQFEVHRPFLFLTLAHVSGALFVGFVARSLWGSLEAAATQLLGTEEVQRTQSTR